MIKNYLVIPFIIIFLSLLIFFSRKFAFPFYNSNINQNSGFSGVIAFNNVSELLLAGARSPGSLSHSLFFPWIQSKIVQPGWKVEKQEGNYNGHKIINVIVKNSIDPPEIIIAAHYDSRSLSDNDPDPSLRSNPVTGANDGASGVAILIELARTIPVNAVPTWLVFLDAEDNGNIPGWEWLLGSRYFVSKLESDPQAVIILDMVGDKNLDIYREYNSNKELTTEIWDTAKSLGYGTYFIDQNKYSLLDDHIPFIEAGIPAMVIIDFDYPYWHTNSDTIDKISAESLQIVGATVLKWINRNN